MLKPVLWLLPVFFYEGWFCLLLWCTALMQKSLLLVSDCTSADSSWAKDCRALPWDTFLGQSKRILQGWILVKVLNEWGFLICSYTIKRCAFKMQEHPPLLNSVKFTFLKCKFCNSWPFAVSCVTNVFITKASVSSLKVYVVCWVGWLKSWAHRPHAR